MVNVFKGKIPHLNLSFHNTSYIESQQQIWNVNQYLKNSFCDVLIKQPIHFIFFQKSITFSKKKLSTNNHIILFIIKLLV